MKTYYCFLSPDNRIMSVFKKSTDMGGKTHKIKSEDNLTNENCYEYVVEDNVVIHKPLEKNNAATLDERVAALERNLF